MNRRKTQTQKLRKKKVGSLFSGFSDVLMSFGIRWNLFLNKNPFVRSKHIDWFIYLFEWLAFVAKSSNL